MDETSVNNGLATYAQFLHMPMAFGSLVIENTNRCNARCRHCYQYSGPQGSEVWGLASLSVEELETVIREALQIETLYPRFHLSGGEAFLDIDMCLHLFRVARESGFHDITAVTNAFWAKRREHAFDVIQRARLAGLTSLEISWDAWHREWVPPEAIENCLEACWEHEVESNLRVLTTKSHSVEEALSYLLPETVEKASRITSGPVFASGRAARELDADDFYVSRMSLDESCHSTLNLTVNSFGNVYPCCAGYDQTDTYVIGNIRRQSIVDIAEAISNSALLRLVVFRGISVLAEIIEGRGVKVGRDYRGICQMCWSIFSRPDCVEAASEHLAESYRRSLEDVIRRLEEHGLDGLKEVL